ncbi:M15 family metallopeptidase [Mycolicibacterium diernhoferi]|uniref:Carboxypeptidase n=1 Tax=Mycolicibacterium diernhoferi TaxID=1801 RepID=A0A1T3WNJ3_9MYCO|nr:M15 family metallopeptidase [Mycolicibacterium diernhoferi]OPE55867.1 carboxypeptidase [Mycolicibacterium diernhoferi]PEG53391.1 carboxypeptidase [Mycolicibacterium diernhoferi]QYL24228.1 M15 family metallopeptidase [Mycolicibacterium diernhoferi]
MRNLAATATLAVAAVLSAPAAQADPTGTAAPQPQPLTAYDVHDPAIANLDPVLRSAVQNATSAAATEGVTMTVTSGWRSPEFQQQLLDEAVGTYGTYEAARRYVQTPDRSRHVAGAAVDIGGPGADQWMITNGPRFGLCQIYANEPWHFELSTDMFGGCPPLLPDAADTH